MLESFLYSLRVAGWHETSAWIMVVLSFMHLTRTLIMLWVSANRHSQKQILPMEWIVLIDVFICLALAVPATCYLLVDLAMEWLLFVGAFLVAVLKILQIGIATSRSKTLSE